jgi:hypothetical protein
MQIERNQSGKSFPKCVQGIDRQQHKHLCTTSGPRLSILQITNYKLQNKNTNNICTFNFCLSIFFVICKIFNKIRQNFTNFFNFYALKESVKK